MAAATVEVGHVIVTEDSGRRRWTSTTAGRCVGTGGRLALDERGYTVEEARTLPKAGHCLPTNSCGGA
ncbi:hypothetical protein [Nitrosovibrio sp. Nv4]|uniref:hypothetical protein n=1 Tax=Nitrosovibrio sp. Nv4 TaxID=1945880 RepID=UPI000D4E8632|nr:hypothetical protein [Nitrosovibrio sp. Nv4]